MDLPEYRQRQARSFYSHLRNTTSPVHFYWQDADNPMPQIGGEPRGPSGYPFLGDNALQLAMASKAQGFQDPRWMTYDQAKAAGGTVRRGEVATKILSWIGGKDGKPYEPILLSVFNGDQIANLEPIKQQGLTAEQQAVRQAGLDALLPTRKKTPTPEQYNARLQEVLAERFPDSEDPEAQAQAILRRELASMTAQARLGLPRQANPELSTQLKPYVDRRPNWREVETAIDDAQKALKDIGIEAMVYEKVARKEVQPDVAPASEPKGRGKTKAKAQDKAPAKAKGKEQSDEIPF
ncbi:ArdC-like ssDNA-binding domain-containing protein [Stenotrophomonas maltophilia]|nr:ArdC-like ssDNA-binding domain-containing protein [Stenotrophomonas maltophilia]